MTEATSRGHAAEPIVQPPIPGVEVRPAMAFTAPPRIPQSVVDQQAGSGRAAPVSGEEKARVMAERQARWDAAGETGTAPVDDPESIPPHEDIEHIEVDLPSGKHVVYGPRPGSNLSWDVAAMMGDESSNMMLSGVVKVVLCIRSIDGKAYQKPGDMILAKKIANLFDERDLDTLFALHNQTWAPLRRSQLPTVKKIFR